MTRTVGGNLNTNEDGVVTTYTLNSVTATAIAANVGKNGRAYISVSLDEGTTNRNVFIRLYPATTDNIQKGIVLTRDTMGNNSLFHSVWELKGSSMFNGEISAITASGTVDVHVTEF